VLTDSGLVKAGSWALASGSSLPPGVSFGGLFTPGVTNVSNPGLSGTPTQTGNYLLVLQAFAGPDRTLDPSPTFTYTIIVQAPSPGGPIITSEPLTQNVNVGASVTFTVATSGTPVPTLQWLKNSVPIAGATGNSFVLTNVTATDAATYTVVAANNLGAAASNGAVLSVGTTPGVALPILTGPLQLVTMNSGSTVALGVTAVSAAAPLYQWFIAGKPISGANSSTLILPKLTAAQAGVYTVTASNASGTTTSQPSALTVTSGAISRISNLSVRTFLASGRTLTIGFVTSGPKNLLLRAVGPSLKPNFGVTQFFDDPMLTVINNKGAIIAQNDDWNASLAPLFVTVGAFPLILNVGGKDAALETLINGPVTAQANGNGFGIILVEVYDADAASANPTAPRLTNVSARGIVGSGDSIFISGFVIDGTAARTVLVRGIGPALHDVFGVASPLSDPLLEIHQTLVNNVDSIVASNDNWDPGLGPIFAQLGAYPFATGSKDSALLVTLPPGVYTAQLSGVNNITGEGVIEIYELP
jgi:Immunoglobulin domain